MADPRVKRWNDNHTVIWKGIEDLGKAEFTEPQLHHHISKPETKTRLGIKSTISHTRLRKHLDGYISERKIGDHATGDLRGCRSFLDEGRIRKVRKGRLLTFVVTGHAQLEIAKQLRSTIRKYDYFEHWDYDPGIPPYTKDSLLRSVFVNFPRGTTGLMDQLPEPSQKYQREFLSDMIRLMFSRFAEAYQSQIKEETLLQAPKRVGVLEWMLRKKKGPMPKRTLFAFEKWLNLRRGKVAVFALEINLERMLELLRTGNGARYFTSCFAEPSFRKHVRYLFNSYRALDSAVNNGHGWLPKSEFLLNSKLRHKS